MPGYDRQVKISDNHSPSRPAEVSSVLARAAHSEEENFSRFVLCMFYDWTFDFCVQQNLNCTYFG